MFHGINWDRFLSYQDFSLPWTEPRSCGLRLCSREGTQLGSLNWGKVQIFIFESGLLPFPA